MPTGLMSVAASGFVERKFTDYTYDAKQSKNESYHNRPFY
jgi:hypothetical protein